MAVLRMPSFLNVAMDSSSHCCADPRNNHLLIRNVTTLAFHFRPPTPNEMAVGDANCVCVDVLAVLPFGSVHKFPGSALDLLIRRSHVVTVCREV